MGSCPKAEPFALFIAISSVPITEPGMQSVPHQYLMNTWANALAVWQWGIPPGFELLPGEDKVILNIQINGLNPSAASARLFGLPCYICLPVISFLQKGKWFCHLKFSHFIAYYFLAILISSFISQVFLESLFCGRQVPRMQQRTHWPDSVFVVVVCLFVF